MRPIRSRCRRTSAEAGFTVIELTVVMALLLLIVVSMLTVFESVQRSSVFTQERSQTLDDMRLAIDRISKDARQASSVNLASTASTLDMQTYVEGVATRVVYRVSGTTLLRESGATSQTVLTDLNTASIFTYAPAVVGAQVVTVTLAVHPARRPDTVLELTSEIRLRNEGLTL